MNFSREVPRLFVRQQTDWHPPSGRAQVGHNVGSARLKCTPAARYGNQSPGNSVVAVRPKTRFAVFKPALAGQLPRANAGILSLTPDIATRGEATVRVTIRAGHLLTIRFLLTCTEDCERGKCVRYERPTTKPPDPARQVWHISAPKD